MIGHVNDLLQLLENTKNTNNGDKNFINIIYENDNLTDLLYQIIESGYEPSIKYQAGSLSHINLQ